MSGPHPPPHLGLLLDVDGPLASPATRTVAPAVLAHLGALLAAGVPVVLNTGRSHDFVAEHLLGPLRAAGLPATARLHAVCEKGAVWSTTTAAGTGAVHVDAALAVPAAVHEVVAALVADPGAPHAATMFVDATKRSMATVEARTGVDLVAYAAAQAVFDAALLAGLAARGLGVLAGGRAHPDADGAAPWRIDPSVISTDVESAAVGKDLGARRALDLLAGDGEEPAAWVTVGDSLTDYAMADELHAAGRAVTHVDVRPGTGAGRPLARDYPVATGGELVDHEAGEALLARLVAELPHPPPTAPGR